MAKTASITLGGTTYTVKSFTLDDLEEMGTILVDGKADGTTSVKILKLALRNADPPANGKIHIDSFAEVAEATKTVLKLAGLEPDEESSPTQAVEAKAEAA